MLAIRLARFGAKKKPTYRVVVIERDGPGTAARLKWSVSTIRSPSRRGQPEARAHQSLDQERRAALRYGHPPDEDESGRRCDSRHCLTQPRRFDVQNREPSHWAVRIRPT